jgi:hypothetical protein
VSQDIAQRTTPEPPVREAAGSARRTVRRVLGSGAIGSGVLAGSLYIWGSHTLAAVAAAASLGTLGMLIGHLRGAHRDITYRATVSRLPETALTDDTIIAMAVYEAVASGQMDSAALAKVLDSAVKSLQKRPR